MTNVTDLIEELHEIFERVFRGCVGDPLRNQHYSSQYRCPNLDCETNIQGTKPYGKKKMSVVWSNGYFHCWVCGNGGNIFYLQSHLQDVDKKQFQKLYAQLHPTPGLDHSQKLEAVSPSVLQLFHNGNFQAFTPFGSEVQDIKELKVLNYLKKRGITQEQIFYYGLLYGTEGVYKNCVIIPSYDANRRLNYFTGRRIIKSDFPYQNPKLNRKEIIFNECFIDWKQPLILCEGPFDYFGLESFNRTCILGSELKEEDKLFQEIVKHKTPIHLLLDSDANKKAFRIAKLFKQWGVFLSVVSLQAMQLKDPGEMQDHHRETLRSLLQSVEQFKIEDTFK